MSQQARLLAVEIKRVLLNCYGSGQAAGFETAQRALWEIGDTIADIHGRRKAAEAIYHIADEILAGDHAAILMLPEALQAPEKLPDVGKLSRTERARALITRNAFTSVYVAFVLGFVIGGAA